MTTADYTEIAVAIATFLLALSTFWMARETREVGRQTRAEARAVAEEVSIAREQVNASQRQAEAAQAAVETSIQPWLTAIERRRPQAGLSDPERFWVVFAHLPRVQLSREGELSVACGLRNVGSGIALLADATLRGRGPGGTSPLIEHPFRAFFSVPVLQPGEDTWITFRWNAQMTDFPHTIDELAGRPGVWGELFIEVACTDIGGRQKRWALVQITATSATAEQWCVHAIEYRTDPAAEPFARVEFDS